jgi:hypothetical protein
MGQSTSGKKMFAVFAKKIKRRLEIAPGLTL